MPSSNGNGQPEAVFFPGNGHQREPVVFDGDAHRRPASFLRDHGGKASAYRTDPAFDTKGMPPNYGKVVVPHVATFRGFFGTYSKVYRASDEALKHSLDNARYMRNDLTIMESLEARQRATALLDWHLEPEDPESPDQTQLAESLTKDLLRIRRFTEFRRVLMEGIWFGRYAIQARYGWQPVGDRMRVLPTPEQGEEHPGWIPVHGDKLVFRYDDGTVPRPVGSFGILCGSRFHMDNPIRTMWQVEPTGRGLAAFVPPEARTSFVIHKYAMEDGAWEAPEDAGSVHGVGIRSRVYWEWFQKQEALAFLMEYLERSAGGIEIWSYPMGDPNALDKAKEAAKERMSNNRNIVFFPKPAGDDAAYYDVQIINPDMAGANAVKELLTEYFGWRIKRYILGQILTSESDATGLGSGVADLHMATFLQIVKYDATNLEETLTHELVEPVKRWNYRHARNVHVRFVIDTESPDTEKRLESYQRAWEMGARLNEADVLEQVGLSAPPPDAVVLENPATKQQQAMPGMDPMGGGGAPQIHGFNPQALTADLAGKLFGDPAKYSGERRVYVAEGGEWVLRTDPDFDTGDRHSAGDGPEVQAYAKQGTLWDEEDHPRDADGKFAEKAGGAHADAITDLLSDDTLRVSEVAEQLGISEDEAQESLDAMVEAGTLEKRDMRTGTRYWVPEATEQDGEPEDEPKQPDPSEPIMDDPEKFDNPREAAAAETERQYQDPDEYAWARASAVPNAGEDLKGSARHKVNAWRSLEEAEADGTAEAMVTKAKLQKNEPANLMKYAPANPLTTLAMHLALGKFPAKPGYGKARRNIDEEEQKKDRRQYLDTYRRLKGKAEELAESEPNHDMALQKFQREIGDAIKELRQKGGTGPTMGMDPGNNTANALVSMHNGLRSYRKKTAVSAQLGKFASLVKENGLGADGAIEKAMDVIEGQSIEKAFGVASKSKGETFKPAEMYVSHARREGGRVIDAKTVESATAYMTGNLGMRGVQYGNSMTDEERQHHLTKSAEAFADLADVLGLDDSQMSLGGTLGMAFGARGHGSALAHYEGDSKVINLTRKKGLGSLAHEWGHAFDHFVGGGGPTDSAYVSNGLMPGHPMNGAFATVRKAWDESGYRKRLDNALYDERKSGLMSGERVRYYSSRIETFARTFERYVQRKLEKSGRANTYLAGIETKAYKQGGFWPTDDEVDAMSPAFDALFEAYKKQGAT